MDNPQEHQNESGQPEESMPGPVESSEEASQVSSDEGSSGSGASKQGESDQDAPASSALHEAMAAESDQTIESEADVSPVQMPAAPAEAARAEFGALSEEAPITDRQAGNISLLLDVKLPVAIELGRTRMSIHEILELGSGSIVELDKLAGEPVDILVNSKPLAKGEVVVLDENFGVRITSLVSPRERLERLNNQ